MPDFTFNVDPVKPRRCYGTEYPLIPASEFLSRSLSQVPKLPQTIESFALSTNTLRNGRPGCNAFATTCLNAYDEHLPIAFSPDEIWLVICQAVSKHIQQDPEACRKAIVGFDGKKQLTVRRDNFVRGSSSNDWAGVFSEFGNQIEEFLGKKRDLFDPTFTTSTPVTKAAIQVQTMSALAPFFGYRMRTMCGFPTVTLQGDAEDWKGIVRRVEAFGEFYPDWAHKPLLAAVEEFARASSGNPDLMFWRSFVKTPGGSGGTPIYGRINAFFPYLEKARGGTTPNPVLTSAESRGAELDEIPASIGVAPMTWEYWGSSIPMSLVSGIFGSTKNSEGQQQCVVGWVVGEAKETTSAV